jgi:hypothetical protein
VSMRSAGLLLLCFAGCMRAQTAGVEDFNPFARSLGAHMFVSAQYGFYRLPANFLIAGESLSQSALVLALSWSPLVYR